MVESIAAMSMNMSAAKLQMDASVSIAKMAMNDQEIALNGLMDMVDAANISSDGMEHVIDTLA
ncbi:MAG: putative motility protein [Firmicutes bacterium]|nr:putative motility protein [Bacillota bacterium]